MASVSVFWSATLHQIQTSEGDCERWQNAHPKVHGSSAAGRRPSRWVIPFVVSPDGVADRCSRHHRPSTRWTTGSSHGNLDSTALLCKVLRPKVQHNALGQTAASKDGLNHNGAEMQQRYWRTNTVAMLFAAAANEASCHAEAAAQLARPKAVAGWEGCMALLAFTVRPKLIISHLDGIGSQPYLQLLAMLLTPPHSPPIE